MIRIEVEDYCQSCLDFSPDLTKPERVRSTGGKELTYTDTIIRCEHKKRCAGIKRYLEQRMKGDSRE